MRITMKTATASLAVVVGLVGCSGGTTSSQSSPQPTQPPSVTPTSVNPSTPANETSILTGRWIFHSTAAVIDNTGQGSLIWRIYTWCGPHVPAPCDLIKNNEIISGGRASFVVDSAPVGVTSGTGRILTSTDRTTFPIGPLTWRLVTSTSLLYLTPFPYRGGYLCGPKAQSSSVCGA